MIATAPRVRWPAMRRQFRTAAAVGAAAPVLAVALIAVLVDRTHLSPPPPQGAAVLAAEQEAFLDYEEAIDAAVEDGGFAVVYGMRPGVADVAEGALPDETLASMASGWLDTMERVRADLAAVEPPAFLAGAARPYDQALAAYVEVAEGLLAAARATGPERAALIEAVPPLGQRADELWDAARAELERHRARLGLPAAGNGPEVTGNPDAKE